MEKVAIHDMNDIYVFCCREILKKHNTNIQYYHHNWLFWWTCLETISYLHIEQKNINIKLKKERSEALFRLENLRPDGFLYGVVLKNTDKRRIDLWHCLLQGHATKEHRHHMLFELPSSPDILFD